MNDTRIKKEKKVDNMRKKKTPTKQVSEEEEIPKTTPTRHRLKCKNLKQKDFSRLITEKEIIFAVGPAGVGKSYVAIARAIELIQNVSNQYSKIVIINPAVEAEEKGLCLRFWRRRR